MGLRVGIVGAGIAGLASAIAQRRVGNEVEIFEQSTFKNEIGAAITMTPNGTRILDSWGFDHKKAGAVESETGVVVHGDTLEVKNTRDLSTCRRDFGHPFNHYHRVDLHNGLRDMALDPHGSGLTPILHLGQKVVDVDCEAGIITLENGQKKTKDLVILADGIWSKFPAVVTKTEKPLSRSHRSAFRTLIPMEDILADEELAKIFKNKPLGFWSPELKMDLIVTYPCRNNTLLNVAVLHDTLPGDEDKTDWHSTASPEEVFAVAKDFHPLVIKLLSKADHFAVHKVMRRDLVETLVRGRAVLIGDAGHWMFPTHAQGAVTGIEESAVIALMTENLASEEVPKRLSQYNELTLDRVHVTQILSNYGPYELAVKKSKRPLPPEGSLQFGEKVREYFYNYDALQDAREYMKQHQQNGYH